MALRIDHLLSAPLFLSPQVADDRLYFVSDLSGRLSLWVMDASGGMPEPLLPPDIALATPRLVPGQLFVAVPALGVIVVMLDRNGDEMLQPCLVPISGGDPVPLFGDRFAGQQVRLIELDADGRGSIWVDPLVRPEQEAYHLELTAPGRAGAGLGEGRSAEGRLVALGRSRYGGRPVGHDPDRGRYLLVDEYSANDTTLWLWERDTGRRRLLHGVPLRRRRDGQRVPLTGFNHAWFVDDDQVMVETTRFDDLGGLAMVSLADPQTLTPVTVTGAVHEGVAEWEPGATRLGTDRFAVGYNADGVSWGYEARLDPRQRAMRLTRVLWGHPPLADGVVQRSSHDPGSGRLAVAFSSASTPAQLAVVSAGRATTVVTRNRVLGIEPGLLSRGEDASYDSHDGLRVHARLYLPSERLGYVGPRPVVHYVHGGPQAQERPDFTWFSMPLIQYLTLHGLAVFVPNVRGSSGYGQAYRKRVDRDWGGQDRLDHVAGVRWLRNDPRLDADRVAVVGRSYGGFMALLLAGRHPRLWSAAVDLFGPYDLVSSITRLPESWQAVLRLTVGDPQTEREELVARSPRAHLPSLACPLLVVQGANDPRVTRNESDELVAELRAAGKHVEYLVFDDEGHDITRRPNKARCYQTITDFLVRHLSALPPRSKT